MDEDRNRTNISEISSERLITASDDGLVGYDINNLIDQAGGFGKYQILLMILGAIAYPGINFFVYNLAFLELVPKLECKYEGQTEYVTCETTDICGNSNVIDYRPDFNDEESFHNWMTEQDLYCESSFMIGLFGSLYFVGFAVSGIYLKQSDRFGRRAILMSGSIIQAIICYILFFSQNYIVYYIFLFLGGFSIARGLCTYIYVTESIPERYQVYVGAFLLAIDPLFVLSISSLYFFSGGKNWKMPLIPCLILPTITFILMLFAPESPRYLYAKKDWKNLRKVIRTIAKVNGSNMSHSYAIDEEVKFLTNSKKQRERKAIEEQETDIDISTGQSEFSVVTALKDSTILINFIVVLVCFSVVSFNYYMISFYLKYVGGNIFINTLSSTISECIGNFAAGGIQRCLGTKKGFIICFAASVVFALPLLLTENEYLITFCVFSSKFFVEGAFCLAYYVNPEVFPPLFVPFSFSVCGLVSRMITIAAPQIAEVKPRQVPVIIFMVFSGVSTVAALFLRKSEYTPVKQDEGGQLHESDNSF